MVPVSKFSTIAVSKFLPLLLSVTQMYKRNTFFQSSKLVLVVVFVSGIARELKEEETEE